ncbi:lethal(2) giant larvae protein-like isoform X2 [Tigriopus californicus]|uniref:lethal(2) giant larvae protein-like isoform X2 n=1 Tax=Tigriopus californicus TaxID=6832 RepID=UPI0027DA6C39|nr:lethal(2) giant larvae protein-like isoform X2 [Tigriopus californicus]
MPQPAHQSQSQSMSNLHNHRMLKFIWSKGHQPNAERLRIQKDLFGFHKEVQHGFPNKPAAMAWDGELKLLAIATKHGALRVVGQPGVEFIGEHEQDQPVSKMIFIPGQGRLVTLTEDNFLHLWEINGTEITEKSSTHLDGRLKRVSVMCHDSIHNMVLLGTEGGNIYQLKLEIFTISENIIYQDIVMKGAPEDFKVNPGAVEGLLIQPNESERILIGYARGLIVLWDRKSSVASQTYVTSQQLESLAWRNDGSQFISSHNDGSFVIWSTQGNGEPLEPPNTPYGPYPCKSISKILWAHQNGSTWVVFSGGMPRASYGDKFSVSVMMGEDKHQVFDLSSKVVEFELFYDEESTNRPAGIFVLTEEELVTIDLATDSWPVFHAPYLNSIHASAITALIQVSNVSECVFTKLKEMGEAERKDKVSDREWPVNGGVVPEKSNKDASCHDLLVTGHEDGSVKLWSCGDSALALLLSVKTNKFFVGDELDEPFEEDEDEEEWPPFRRIGLYDPYSDDPRLAIKKLAFCRQSGRLLVGGTAGQVLVCELQDQAVEAKMLPIKVDLVTEKEGFAWKGHAALTIRTNEIKMEPGYQPSCVIQVSPPASINSLVSSKEWELAAIGTAHGLVLLDCIHQVAILTKCTLNAQDIANADDNPMSRRKSLKKSLRESFRRLRKGRSQRNIDKKRPGVPTDPIKKELRSESPESRPVERQVEARSGSEDGLGSMVRCLHFANTFIANPQTLSATLWAGTNSGQILVFLITLPGSEKRSSVKSSAILGKEIQLKHKAPVIAIEVLDAGGVPVHESNPDGAPAPHKVLIASEEQFKTFLLPTLKPSGKYKLTAHEGARIRKIGFTTFKSRADSNYMENCLMCLTNQGDISIHSLPEMRRQIQTNCVKKEDVIAISSFVFAPTGEAFYSCSSSELQRVSVAAGRIVRPSGYLQLAEDARPVAKEEKSAPASTTVDKPEEAPTIPAAPSPGDPHNDTTMSEVSGDITLDSVKDHTMSSISEHTSTVVSSSSSLTISRTVQVSESKTITTASSSGTAISTESTTKPTSPVNGENPTPEA